MPVLVYTFAANAGLYRGVDSEGNVVYSDTPFEDAEKFTPPAISVVAAPKTKVKDEAAVKKEAVEFKYMSFDISTPSNNQTIRNEPELTVSLNLKPGLNTEESHSIWMLVDGKPVVKNTQSLSMKLGRLERGAHELQAQIRNKENKIVLRTRPVLIFVHHASGN